MNHSFLASLFYSESPTTIASTLLLFNPLTSFGDQELIDEDALEPHVIWGSVGLFLVFLPGLSAAVGELRDSV